MLPLFGGIILLAIGLFFLWVVLSPMFNKIGSKVNKKINYFKNGGNKENE